MRGQATSIRRLGWAAGALLRMPIEQRFAFRSPAAIARIQSRRVKAVVAHAYASVPYYREVMRELGLHPSDFTTAADLARLPVLERTEVQRDPDRFASERHPRDRCEEYRSSGGSGAPLTVWWDRAALFRSLAYMDRYESVLRSLIGVRLGGYREIRIGRRDSNGERMSSFYRSGWAPRALAVERLRLEITDPPEANVDAINRFRPDVIRTYGAYLEDLVDYLHRSGAPFAKPRLVVPFADALADRTRRALEEELGILVLRSYGAIEAMPIGFQCELRSGYHLNLDLHPIRIVDREGREVEHGGRGEVVVSNLVNRGMVLLNYRLGDLATREPRPCKCGRNLPTIGSLIGRTSDQLELQGGRRLYAEALTPAFNGAGGVNQWQVRQTDPSRLQVFVVAAPQAAGEGLQRQLAQGLRERVPGIERVDVSFVDRLPLPESGKRKSVIRDF